MRWMTMLLVMALASGVAAQPPAEVPAPGFRTDPPHHPWAPAYKRADYNKRGPGAPSLDPRDLGVPPTQLEGEARILLLGALRSAGLIEPEEGILSARDALVELQRAEELAPTGYLDRDTAQLLGLPVDEVLPRERGAGAMYESGAGAAASGGQVGGERGPASMPPTAQATGQVRPIEGSAAFALAEAHRLDDAADALRSEAIANREPSKTERLLDQARKADEVAALNRERYEALGGADAIADSSPGVISPGGPARAAFSPEDEDTVELDRAELESLQRALVEGGFLHEAPSGQLDTSTRDALRAYQTSVGREPTGALDRPTTSELLGPPPIVRPNASPGEEELD